MGTSIIVLTIRTKFKNFFHRRNYSKSNLGSSLGHRMCGLESEEVRMEAEQKPPSLGGPISAASGLGCSRVIFQPVLAPGVEEELLGCQPAKKESAQDSMLPGCLWSWLSVGPG